MLYFLDYMVIYIKITILLYLQDSYITFCKVSQFSVPYVYVLHYLLWSTWWCNIRDFAIIYVESPVSHSMSYKSTASFDFCNFLSHNFVILNQFIKMALLYVQFNQCNRPRPVSKAVKCRTHMFYTFYTWVYDYMRYLPIKPMV